MAVGDLTIRLNVETQQAIVNADRLKLATDKLGKELGITRQAAKSLSDEAKKLARESGGKIAAEDALKRLTKEFVDVRYQTALTRDGIKGFTEVAVKGFGQAASAVAGFYSQIFFVVGAIKTAIEIIEGFDDAVLSLGKSVAGLTGAKMRDVAAKELSPEAAEKLRLETGMSKEVFGIYLGRSGQYTSAAVGSASRVASEAQRFADAAGAVKRTERAAADARKLAAETTADLIIASAREQQLLFRNAARREAASGKAGEEAYRRALAELKEEPGIFGQAYRGARSLVSDLAGQIRPGAGYAAESIYGADVTGGVLYQGKTGKEKLSDFETTISDRTTLLGGGFGAMTDAITASVDAAITGSDSIGKAFLKASAMALKALAIESTVRALYNTAMGVGAVFLNPAAAGGYFAAAAQFAATAVLAGAGAAALGAATGGFSGGSSAGARGYAGGGGFHDYSSARGGGGDTINVYVTGQLGSAGETGRQIADAVQKARRSGRIKDESGAYA